jgi:hypothetical protein
MHGIGQIDGGRSARQGEYLALGAEDVDFAREQVHLDVLEKLRRVAAGGLQLNQ